MTERITMTDQCVPTGMPTTLPSRTLCCFMVAPPRLTAAPRAFASSATPHGYVLSS